MAYMTHNKHYQTGDARPPPPAKGVLRVYGMKFCPFVHRLKLVMHAVGVDHETINCNTVKKPEWFFDINPRGTVPALEQDGEIIFESDITSRYINDLYGKDKQLVTKDPLRRAKEEILFGDLQKGISGIFGYGRAKDDEGRKNGVEKMEECLKSLEKFLLQTKQPYIGGDQAGFNDFMFWPTLERIAVLHRDLVKKNSSVNCYYENMLNNESVKACRHPDQLTAQFLEGYFKGTPIYDMQ